MEKTLVVLDKYTTAHVTFQIIDFFKYLRKEAGFTLWKNIKSKY